MGVVSVEYIANLYALISICPYGVVGWINFECLWYNTLLYVDNCLWCVFSIPLLGEHNLGKKLSELVYQGLVGCSWLIWYIEYHHIFCDRDGQLFDNHDNHVIQTGNSHYHEYIDEFQWSYITLVYIYLQQATLDRRVYYRYLMFIFENHYGNNCGLPWQ